MKPVLIIEDDPDIAEGVRYNLEREGLEARVALERLLRLDFELAAPTAPEGAVFRKPPALHLSILGT